MGTQKKLLAEIAIGATQAGQTAVIYFGPHKLAAVRAQIEEEIKGLLICQNSNEETFSIDIEMIDAVFEADAPFAGFDIL